MGPCSVSTRSQSKPTDAISSATSGSPKFRRLPKHAFPARNRCFTWLGVIGRQYSAGENRRGPPRPPPKPPPALDCGGKAAAIECWGRLRRGPRDRKSTRLNSSHGSISYAVFCLKKKKKYKENGCVNKHTTIRGSDPHIRANVRDSYQIAAVVHSEVSDRQTRSLVLTRDSSVSPP